jgi:hypothetical protein
MAACALIADCTRADQHLRVLAARTFDFVD